MWNSKVKVHHSPPPFFTMGKYSLFQNRIAMKNHRKLKFLFPFFVPRRKQFLFSPSGRIIISYCQAFVRQMLEIPLLIRVVVGRRPAQQMKS
jgi:hypothetical protein